MDIYLTKTQTGFVPADIPTEEWIKKVKHGEVIAADFRKVRNPAFLRKYFALLNVGYDNWSPGEVDSKYGIPEKNFDQFRKDVTILAGYYHTVIRLNGEVRIEAKSISFAKMEEEEFEKLYNQTIDVLLRHVYGSGMTTEELDNIVNQYMGFV